MKAYALLDSCSSNSFCSQRLAQKLDLKGQSVTYDFSTMNKTVSLESRLVDLSLLSDTGERLDMSDVYIIDAIPVRTSKLNVSSYPHLADRSCFC